MRSYQRRCSSHLTVSYSIIAIMLGRLGMTVVECIEKYEELMGLVFGTKISWSFPGLPVSGLGNVVSQYDSGKVKSAIEEVLAERGFDKDSMLNDGTEHRCKVLVWT